MKTLLSISMLFIAGSNASERSKGDLEIFCPVSPNPSCSKSPKPYPTYYLKPDPQASHKDQEFFRGETPTSNCSSPLKSIVYELGKELHKDQDVLSEEAPMSDCSSSSKRYQAFIHESDCFFNGDPCVLSAEEFLTTAAGMAYLESMKKNNKQ